MISKELLQCLNDHLTIDEIVSTDNKRIDNNIYWHVKEIDILPIENELETKVRLKFINNRIKICAYPGSFTSMNLTHF
jgi:hypothetical protein